MIPEDDNEVNI